MTEERVYVIGTPGSSTVKIGRTIDLKKRLAEIQRMSPVPLKALWSTPGGHALETYLHRHFKARRSHGEWFALEGDPAATIRAVVASYPPPARQVVNENARPHVAHPPGEWCQECELWPHESVTGDDGWCIRCDIHANDHDASSFVEPRRAA